VCDVEWNFKRDAILDLEQLIDSTQLRKIPDLSHCQVQTLLGAVGLSKGFDVWIPANSKFS